ncbi:MAG: DUF134 domain-containing protein [Bacteroidales bacterium]|jgi:predicted DNA-binding protein (UPF0251 family)|nr:DUF134 domain-containing protein [Bacteroidales bacterium]
MCPRPKRYRRVFSPPKIKGLKPFGIPFVGTYSVSLQYEEYETIRLADYENLSQAQAAIEMNISRPTFTRIYEIARKKIAEAIVDGKSIIIEGGDVEFDKQWYRCNNCYNVFNATGNNIVCSECASSEVEHINNSIYQWRNCRGKRHGMKRNVENSCICPNCNTKIKHIPGMPCNEFNCPNCRKSMIRLM